MGISGCSLKKRITTINISIETKENLDKIKIHRREPYEDVVKRLLEIYNKVNTNEVICNECR
jgi:thymidine kinase